MKVLIVGGGGREHALAWRISRSPLVSELFCAPGNPGIASLATLAPIEATSTTELAAFAADRSIDLVVVGPEQPLTAGIADELERRGLPVFGPSAAAARLESSKVFAKEFMRRHGIPTAPCEVFTDHDEAQAYLARPATRFPLVVKADGLAAGKGVVVCAGREQAAGAVREIMAERVFGASGDRILVEEFAEGREVSFFALSDGARAVPMASCQ